MNYYSLGLSLMFVAKKGTSLIVPDDIDTEKLELDSIDLYNTATVPGAGETDPKSSINSYASYPASPVVLSPVPSDSAISSSTKGVTFAPTSIGKD